MPMITTTIMISTSVNAAWRGAEETGAGAGRDMIEVVDIRGAESPLFRSAEGA